MTRQNRIEFLGRSKKVVGSGERQWRSPMSSSSPWTISPVQGSGSPPNMRVRKTQQDYYSIFHKTPNRRKFSKREWQIFTEEMTKQAMGDLASSPEFTDWVIKNASRIQLLPEDSDSDEMLASGSNSKNGNAVENRERFSFFRL